MRRQITVPFQLSVLPLFNIAMFGKGNCSTETSATYYSNKTSSDIYSYINPEVHGCMSVVRWKKAHEVLGINCRCILKTIKEEQ